MDRLRVPFSSQQWYFHAKITTFLILLRTVPVDGTPRAVNCEFEFVKAEFYRTESVSPGVTDTISYGAVTPASTNLEIKEPYSRYWVVSDISQFFVMPIKVKVTIRRIAPAPAGTNSYILRNNLRSAVPGNPGPGEYSSKAGWGVETDDQLKPVSVNILVHGTYTFIKPMISVAGSNMAAILSFPRWPTNTISLSKTWQLRKSSVRHHTTTSITAILQKRGSQSIRPSNRRSALLADSRDRNYTEFSPARQETQGFPGLPRRHHCLTWRGR